MGEKLKNGGFAVEVAQLPELWRDRKRHLGLPISFTVYSLNADKLMIHVGLFNWKEDEIMLYRIRDVSVQQSLADRIFGVGTVCITSSDASVPHLDLQHVKNPRKVKEVLSKCVEDSRRRNGIRSTELMSGRSGPHPDAVPGPDGPMDAAGPNFIDEDGNGIDDRLE